MSKLIFAQFMVRRHFKWLYFIHKSTFNVSIKTNKIISMESYTFAGTSARRYRIVDAEERSCWIFFNVISSFCGLKCMDINEVKKSKNIRQNNDFTFHHQKRFQKKKLNHVTLFVTFLLHSIFIILRVDWLSTCHTSIYAH
jgi:hypothetical protein